MFKIASNTLKCWDELKERRAHTANPIEVMDQSHFDRLEEVYGYPLPAAYKEFMSNYGAVTFPDEGGNRFMYSYEIGEMKEFWEGSIGFVANTETLVLNHQHMIADADNDTEESFFPPFMLPFGTDPQQSKILLELSNDTPRIWYWEDQPDAWGQGDNKLLGAVADNLYDFMNNLK